VYRRIKERRPFADRLITSSVGMSCNEQAG
jgi:hypothetical protein